MAKVTVRPPQGAQDKRAQARAETRRIKRNIYERTRRRKLRAEGAARDAAVTQTFAPRTLPTPSQANAHVAAEIELRQQVARLTQQLNESRAETAQVRGSAPTQVAQVRRVVRTIVITGSPAWVAQTLEKSLPVGLTRMGLGNLVVTEDGDVTHQVLALGRADRNPSRTTDATSELFLAV